MARRSGLGKGLGALIPGDTAEVPDGVLREVPVGSISPNTFQPRDHFDEEQIASLAASIRELGVLQPILVRPASNEQGLYEIIAGERRFRAAQIAGLTEVPVLVRDVADEHAAAMALIENIQREDLNPLEEAQGVRRLLDEFGLTHEQVAAAIGRSRPATSNMLRLLNLAAPVQTMLLAGDIDMGHARALLAVDAATQIQLANQVVARRLSVRETEKLASKAASGPDAGKSTRTRPVSRDTARLEESLSDQLATRVSLKANARGRGQILIDFHGWEHCSALLEKLGLREQSDE